MKSPKTCNHKSKKSENPELESTNKDSQSISTNGSGKSLSFFPDNGDAEIISDHSNIHELSEANNNTSNEHQSHLDDVVLTATTNDIPKQDVIDPLTPRLGADEKASTASSCSCEDHSSVDGHFDEDPHGDLDYDDDSVAGSPSTKQTVQDSEDTLEPLSSSLNETTNNPQDDQNSQSSNNPNNRSQEPSSHIDANVGASSQNPTKIQSFINFDTGRESDDEVDSETKRHPKDKSRKSYEGLLKHFLKDACYFQMKSINHENVQISKTMGVWQTPIQNEIRLNTAFREHRNVILIFSVQQSGAFQGFARMSSESGPASRPVPWILPERLSSAVMGGVIQLEWLCTKELNFNETRDLYNPFNNNKPIKIARDGQQVEPRVGRKLCSLFPKDSKKRLLVSLENLKDESCQRGQLNHERTDYHPPSDPYGDFASPRRHHLGAAPNSGMVFNGYDTIPSSSASHHRHGGYLRPPSGLMGPHDIFATPRLPENHSLAGYNNRTRPFLDPASPNQRPPAHRMRNIASEPVAHPDSAHHGDLYMSPFRPSHYQPGFVHDPFAYHQQSSRAYYDWHHQRVRNNAAALPPSHQRFHPYMRTRR